MDIVSANYGLVKRVLDRYKNSGLKKVEIHLTHHRYVKGHEDCFKLIDGHQIKLLEDLRIFQTEEILPNNNNPNIKLYKGSIFIQEAKKWYEEESSVRQKETVHPLIQVLTSENGKKKASNETRRMAKLFVKNNRVQNYQLMQCITGTVNTAGKKRKLSKTDYKSKKESYNKEIYNRFKTLKKYWEPSGYTVKFHHNFSELVTIK